MSAPDDSTRPVSVAELLARNGTIGSPPIGGRRRRGRRNSDGVSVAELTGEIPVIRTGEIPIVEEQAFYEEPSYQEAGYAEVTYAEQEYEETAYAEQSYEEVAYAEPVYEEVTYAEPVYQEVAYAEPVYEEVTYAEPVYQEVAYAEPVYQEVTYAEPVHEPVYEEVTYEAAEYDPRPLRESSGAELMAFDPVDESVNLADLIDEPALEAEDLRSYLRTSTDTLFSGGTVADDLARRGIAVESDRTDSYDTYDDYEPADARDTAAGGRLGVAGTLWGGAVAVLQSLLAVVLGAGLFLGFDRLWRWNNLVALMLSVLVVLTLAAGVRYVRKTEDIVSTLTAVAVGLLVTLGPLALQST